MVDSLDSRDSAVDTKAGSMLETIHSWAPPVLLALLILLTGCSEEEEAETLDETPTDVPLSMSTPGAQPRMQNGTQILTLRVTRNGIRPVEALFKAGSPIQLLVEKTAEVECPAMEIEALGLQQRLSETGQTEWGIPSDTTGTFTLSCAGAGEVLQSRISIE